MSNKCLIAFRYLVLSAFLTLSISSAHSKDQPQQTLTVEVGGSTLVNLSDVSRIAVGDSQVAQVTSTGTTGILIFGKTRGFTHVDIWSKSGKHLHYEVRVNPRGFEASYVTVKKLLSDISTVTVTKSDDKIVLEGVNVSDHDKRRVAQISAQYPDILDLTNVIGWDRMILLDVLVLELPSTRLRELGLKWDANPSGGMTSTLNWAAGSSAATLGFSAILSARIDAMSRKGEAVILAQPQLLTRSGATANFLAGGEVPYSTTDKDGRVNTFFKKYGVSLNITPQANSQNTVRSGIEIEVSSVDPTIMLPNGPAMRVRRASTEFNVRSGQTLILGGFISREKSRDWDGLPGISETSIFRHLFGSERTSERQTELAILVTPHIVDPSNAFIDKRAEQVRGVIEEAFSEATNLRGIAESHDDNHEESAVNRDFFSDQWDD